MMKPTNTWMITAIVAIAALAGSATAAPILINFSGDPATNYTGDGSTTWQTFNYDTDGSKGFEDIATTELLDVDGNTTGVTFAFDGHSLVEYGNDGATEAEFNDSKPAIGFDWFDASVAELRETTTTNSNNVVEYIFDGFNPADEITFSFVLGRSSASNNRRINFGLAGGPLLLDSVQTAGVGLFVTTTVTGASSYTFEAAQPNISDSPSSVVNAMQIVPEPATMSLLALGGLVALRRRRRWSD